uniref:DUF3108 domain-containing protein n=1 Tax=Schlesneria paludicola TaxID=360056 RepID=A0A7C4LNB9_9PLAN
MRGGIVGPAARHVLTVLLVALGTGAAAHAEATLRYKFKAGDETRYVLTQSLTTEVTLPQQEKPVTTGMTQSMYFKNVVDEVTSTGSARLRQTYTRIKLSVRSSAAGAQSFDYDSAAEEQPTGPIAESILKSIKPLLNAEIQQTISPRGEISDVIVPQSLLDAFKSNPALAAMGNTFSAEGFKNLSAQSAVSFPDKPLAVGDAWDQAIDLKLPFGKLTTTKTMRYGGKDEHGLEKLGISTTMTMEPAANPQVSMKLTKGQGAGAILFDPLRGRVHSSTLKQTMEAEIMVAGQKIQQKSETEVALQLDEGTATR